MSTFSIKICNNDFISYAVLSTAVACFVGYYMLCTNEAVAGNMYFSFIFSFSFIANIKKIKADNQEFLFVLQYPTFGKHIAS